MSSLKQACLIAEVGTKADSTEVAVKSGLLITGLLFSIILVVVSVFESISETEDSKVESKRSSRCISTHILIPLSRDVGISTAIIGHSEELPRCLEGRW